jgi:glycosyl-4,4'-diaponeurosporenoate acyltransferase
MCAAALPAGTPDPGRLVLSSAAFWLLASLLVGGLANRLPQRWLQGSPAPAQISVPAPPVAPALAPLPPPGPGLGIRRWKRWIPDAGGALPGGVAKASLVRRDRRALERLVVETRRAELVHALLWPAGLLTALWLPPEAVLVNLGFATLFNLPCLLLQRHNRRRLRRCLARIDRRALSRR